MAQWWLDCKHQVQAQTHLEGEAVTVDDHDTLDVTDLVGVMLYTSFTMPDTCIVLCTPVLLNTRAWMVRALPTATSYAVTLTSHGADVTVPAAEVCVYDHARQGTN